MISGTAEPGSSVDIDVNGDGDPDYTVEADAETGDFTVDTSDTPLVDGETITATATDDAGNESEPTTITATDTTAPTAPSVMIGDGDDTVDGFDLNANGDVTVSVTLPEDAKIGDTVTVNGTETMITQAMLDDGYETTVMAPAEGEELSVTATVTDQAGNSSEPTTVTATVGDITAPTAPSVVINEEGTMISGTAEAGSRVEIDVNGDGDPDYTVEADAETGGFTVDTSDTPLVDGETITATATDDSGNESEPTTITAMDTTAPEAPLAAPVITDNVDGNGDVLDPAETIPNEGITNDNTPSVTVPADQVANGTPQLVVNGDVVASTPVTNADGSVTLTPVDALEDDSYEISYNLIDEAGNVSEASPATTITVDTVAPGGEVDAAIAAPVVVIDDEALDGVNAAEFVDGVQTQVTLPSGTVAGDTVTLTVTLAGGDPITVEYEVTEDDLDANLGNGIADVTIPNDMADGITADGTYSVTATVTDAAGNVSAPSDAASFTVDTAAPGQPTVIIGNGDDLVNGFDLSDNGLVEVTVVLPDNAEVGDTVTVDGMATLITQGMLANGYNFAVEVPLQGTVLTVTANVTDQAGNAGPTGTDSATVGDTTVPAVLIPEALDGVNATEFADGIQTQVTLPTGTVAGDIVTVTVTPDSGNPIIIEYEVTAADLDVNDGDGIAEITIPNGVDGISDNGAYTVVATVTDVNENVSAPSAAVEFDLNTTFTARDDLDGLDLGALQVTYYDPISESDLDVLGVAEGTGGADSSLGFTVSAGASGTVNIEVSQTALVTVADAINIEVYNSNNELVYVGTTGGDPLVGNVIGIELLGLTGNDTLTATVSGLEPDNYTIVVRNDESALAALVNGLTLAELGEAGVVLGPDNQEVVFTTIDNALGSVLGGTVNGLLNIALTAAGDEGLGLDAVVDILEDNVLGLGLLDPLLDDITAVLLSNTLTLLETTDITATVTEFDYADDTVITGNVIDPDASSSGELGEDTLTVDTVLTNIGSNDSQSEPTSTVVNGITVFTIQGQYGVLVIDENGDYTYTANGDFASLGQSETFTYTVSDGVISDTAELVIELDDMTPPATPTIDTPIAGDDVVNSQEAADGFNITGTGEVGAIITLTDETGDVIGTATVGADGIWSVPVDQADVVAMDEGVETLSATATDPSGNESSAVITDITVDTVAPTANNDQDYAGLVIDPVTTSPAYSGSAGGLLNLNALGAIDLGVLSTNSVFQTTVTADQELSLTLDGSGSVFVNLASGSKDFSLSVYRVVSGEDDITLVQQEDNWLKYSPYGGLSLGGSWSATDLSLPTLTGGADGKDATYYFLLGSSNNSLLGVSLGEDLDVYSVSSQLIDYDNFNTVPTTGNVITNNDIDAHIVTAVDGVDVDGPTTIQGTYGSLEIAANGNYTYTPTEDADGIDQTDEFVYTVEDVNGNTATATLSVDLNSDGQAPAPVIAPMSANSFTLTMDDTIELPDTLLTTSSEGVDTLSFEGSGQIISLSDMMQPDIIDIIDIIDIGGIGANTLNIAAEDVDATIYIKGDNDDTVNLEGDSWASVGQTTSEGEVYDVWQSGSDISNQVHIDTEITNII